jgi:DNA-binding response OmpR family regulator
MIWFDLDQGDHVATDLGTALSQRPLPPPTHRATRDRTRPRLVVVSSDTETVQLLRDTLADSYEISALTQPPSITAIDASDPDVVIVGMRRGGLTADQIVALASRHMRLRSVPIVVMSGDPNLLHDAGRLSSFPGVSFVLLPFDVETIRSVIDSVVRTSAVPRSIRLPDMCPHGFDVADEHCRRCS